MHRIRVYVDTSVFGGTQDDEFAEPSRRFFEQVRNGAYVVLLSKTITEELRDAPQAVQGVLLSLPDGSVEALGVNPESEALAQAYIDAGVLGEASRTDAFHVAVATVAEADLILSWNFRHIVNFNRIRLFHSVNLAEGYRAVDIRSPLEVAYDD